MDDELKGMLCKLLTVVEATRTEVVEHGTRLTRIESILNRHSEMLQHHSDLLQHHSEVLQHHSEVLQHHSDLLQHHSEVLQHQSEVLEDHSAKLDSQSAKLDGHDARLARLEELALENKAGQTKLQSDVAEIKHVTGANHFRLSGRIDQLSDMMMDHMGNHHSPHGRKRA